jgi:anaerobic sulfite reductase subunit C
LIAPFLSLSFEFAASAPTDKGSSLGFGCGYAELGVSAAKKEQQMKWSKKAEEAVSQIPFFIRKRVKKKVEEEAARCGSPVVTLDHVQTCQQRFLKNMDQEVKGYSVETCFGPTGCPNRAVDCEGIGQELGGELEKRKLKEFLKERIPGPLKMHHEFRVSLSCCPNACSRPQIADFGIIGASRPEVTEEPCNQCRACLEVCPEGAISLTEEAEAPAIDYERCLFCGQCLKVCPAGTLQEGKAGFRVQVGGKLGRHPRLARDLGVIFPKAEMLKKLKAYLDHYQAHNQKGERLGEILNRIEMNA